MLLSGFGLFLRCFSCNSTGTSHTNPSRCPWKKDRNFRKLLETAKMDKSLHVSTFNSTKHIKVTLFAKQTSPVSLDTLSNSLFLHFHLHFLQQVHHLTQKLHWDATDRVRSKFPAFRIGLAPLARARGTSMSRHNTAMPTSESLLPAFTTYILYGALCTHTFWDFKQSCTQRTHDIPNQKAFVKNLLFSPHQNR